MEILLGYLMVAFLGGIALWQRKLASRTVILLVICVLICIAYFFGDKI